MQIIAIASRFAFEKLKNEKTTNEQWEEAVTKIRNDDTFIRYVEYMFDDDIDK